MKVRANRMKVYFRNSMQPKLQNNEIIMKQWLNIQLITACIMSLGGLVMLFCGIYISPLGQIHESLLVGFGEVATFAGSLMGIDYHYKAKEHGKD